ncbi:MAG: M15 family metallopeptidase [Halieaceae bacterium]|jgi:LAS superfamily LD-carboxypeptidase LdcB|nr:M15 family metallopeptidase [Halieaceae bacterium]
MLTNAQLTGCDDAHIEQWQGVGLTAGCRAAFQALQHEAAAAGFDLQIASGFRSFERQRAIFNAKATGKRPVHDDEGVELSLEQLDDSARLHAILRFSALPGASRHHWGSDIDVYDAAAVPEGYAVQLSPAEVADNGVFGPLHRWLDARIDAADAFGFYRPYDRERGGVAPERWHLSYAPEARVSEAAFSTDVLQRTLSALPAGRELAMADQVMAALPGLVERYVRAVAPAPAVRP